MQVNFHCAGATFFKNLHDLHIVAPSLLLVAFLISFPQSLFHNPAANKPLLDFSATPFRLMGRVLHLFAEFFSSSPSFLLAHPTFARFLFGDFLGGFSQI